MTKQYQCDLCKKVFNQKVDLTRHQNKKAPCITLAELQKINQQKEIKTDDKNMLVNAFKSCLNILRDNEGLTGEKALRNMSYLLILKLLEPHFDGEINIDNYTYDFSHIEDNKVDKHKIKLLDIARFSKLVNEDEKDIIKYMKFLWNDILSVHPSTNKIFLKDKGFDIRHDSTYKKLIDRLSSLDLSRTEYDVLGNAYEEVIQDIMTGKVLGQFFTQPLVKKMMVKLINPQIHPDGKIDTCGDPTMGTGGFLITYLQYILQQASTRNITPDWEFIKSEGLYGKELEPDTYQLAVSNMLISTGHMFDVLERGDSIRDPITRKFDNILANPPFGIKGLRYDDFENPIKDDYVPIKTDNAVSLFIQAIIYMLKINGKCAIVLPDGQDLFSKTNTTLVAVREYLLKTCDLKEVIYLPSGIFNYTSIKTCVFYFIKKREGVDVLEAKIKSKTKKIKEYKFSKTYQTTKVIFYDYNPYEDIKNLLVEVPIEKIADNSYSLNYSEYLTDEIIDELYDENIIVKSLGDICKFDIGGTPSRSKNEYYDNGTNLWVSVRELNGGYIYDTKEKITDLGVQNSSVKLFDKDTVLFSFKLSIGKTAIAGNPLYTNEAIAGISSKNNDLLNNKYLYYYLTITDFSKLGSGILGNGSLNKKSLGQIKIPIPSLELQLEIVKYLDFIYEKANKTSEQKINELKQLNEYCLNNQKLFGKNEVKRFGDVFQLESGKIKASDCDNNGDYMFITNADNKTHSQYSIDGENLFICRINASKVVFKTKIKYYNGKCCYSSLMSRLKPIIENISLKYYYYYFNSIITQIEFFNKGVANKTLDIELLSTSLIIPIPSLERQREIVEYCEHNDALIKQLETEIEHNKQLAKQFINSILNNSVVEENPDEIILSESE